jgi:hypothetical protein
MSRSCAALCPGWMQRVVLFVRAIPDVAVLAYLHERRG